MATHYEHLRDAANQLGTVVEHRDELLDRVLYLAQGVVEDLSENAHLWEKNVPAAKAVAEAADRLASGITNLHEGEYAWGIYNFSLASEALVGGLPQTHRRKHWWAFWSRPQWLYDGEREHSVGSCVQRIECSRSLIRGEELTAAVELVVGSARALLDCDPENAIYKIAKAIVQIAEFTQFERIRNQGYTNRWAESFPYERWERWDRRWNTYESHLRLRNAVLKPSRYGRVFLAGLFVGLAARALIAVL